MEGGEERENHNKENEDEEIKQTQAQELKEEWSVSGR